METDAGAMTTSISSLDMELDLADQLEEVPAIISMKMNAPEEMGNYLQISLPLNKFYT